MAKNKRPKLAKVAAEPTGAGKAPRAQHDPSDANARSPAWVFSCLDVDGPWCKGCVTEEHAWEHILPKICNYETMTWAQIELDRKRNHSVSVGQLCKEARDRLAEIQPDVDELFRLRLSGEQRLWGIRDRERFKIIWWDPHHEICPAPLRNT